MSSERICCLLNPLPLPFIPGKAMEIPEIGLKKYPEGFAVADFAGTPHVSELELMTSLWGFGSRAETARGEAVGGDQDLGFGWIWYRFLEFSLVKI